MRVLDANVEGKVIARTFVLGNGFSNTRCPRVRPVADDDVERVNRAVYKSVDHRGLGLKRVEDLGEDQAVALLAQMERQAGAKTLVHVYSVTFYAPGSKSDRVTAGAAFYYGAP